MKVFIFDSTPLEKAPYIENYTSVCKLHGIEYKICCWDKFNDGAVTVKDNVITIHKKCANGIKKLFDFYFVSMKIKEILEQDRYTHLVIINSVWALLLYDVLEKFKNKYILDIRDYKFEDKYFIPYIMKHIVNNSFFTTISSMGFSLFLPNSNKIIVNHNISNWNYEEIEPTVSKYKKNKIIFLGHIRYLDVNRKIINTFKNQNKYSLTYKGTYAIGCELGEMQDLFHSNVYFEGRFKNSDKPIIYKEYDLINSVYGNDEISVITLTPNRLYDCIIYKKPIIASKNTTLSEIVSRYDLGICVDLDTDNVVKKLDEYISTFDRKKFMNGCAAFREKVEKEQKTYWIYIHAFLDLQ